MKHFFSLLIGISITLLVNAQKTVGIYSGGAFVINLTSTQKNQVLDTILARNGLSGCTLDSVVINDQGPASLDSAAYVLFYVSCGHDKYTFGYFLTKTDGGHGTINYNIDNTNYYAERAWKCDANGECNSCKPVRNWFLGPVTGCDCPTCHFSTSGSGITVGDVVAILTLILTFFQHD